MKGLILTIIAIVLVVAHLWLSKAAYEDGRTSALYEAGMAIASRDSIIIGPVNIYTDTSGRRCIWFASSEWEQKFTQEAAPCQ
jgi:hypothetical protein